jgi:hypothetical protein
MPPSPAVREAGLASSDTLYTHAVAWLLQLHGSCKIKPNSKSWRKDRSNKDHQRREQSYTDVRICIVDAAGPGLAVEERQAGLAQRSRRVVLARTHAAVAQRRDGGRMAVAVRAAGHLCVRPQLIERVN